MEVLLYGRGEERVLILNTGGEPPDPKERALFLCRSVTLLGEAYLMGPVDDFRGFLSVDQDGFPESPESWESEAFGAFLRDTEQGGNMPLPSGAELWHRIPLPDIRELLAI